ncbi:hypothetical protein L6452_20103 [Arctium lappa]|uniref:Uncharacterized protein n=1 Tax=Arctium lappa TaxID=4217 RepID=A0ACB9BCB1_ARCLA|nr:hypothetical protein L6452_20103 [Arctium lappa]
MEEATDPISIDPTDVDGWKMRTDDGRVEVEDGDADLDTVEVGGADGGWWSRVRRRRLGRLRADGKKSKENSSRTGAVVFEDGNRRKRYRGVIATAESGTITRKLRFKARVTVSADGSLLTPPLMVSNGLTNRNIGRNLHLHPVLLAWGHFPESSVPGGYDGKSYEGTILTSFHKVTSAGETSNETRAIIEVAAMGPSSFASLFPGISGADIKDKMVKYLRIVKLFSLVKIEALSFRPLGMVGLCHLSTWHGGALSFRPSLVKLRVLETKMAKGFRQEHEFSKRHAEASRIREKYPDRIPVIVERAEKSDIPNIDKKKYLVPADLTVGQFVYVIRKRIKLSAEKAIFIFVENVLPPTGAIMSTIYDEKKDDDGFLYVTYSGENTFGSFLY